MTSLHVLAVIPGTESDKGFVFARRQLRHLRELGATVTLFPLETRTSLRGLIRAAAGFRSLIRDLRPDVVHAHYGSATGLFCALLSPVPVVVTFRGTDLNPSSEFSGVRALVSRWMSQATALFAREIICVSSELRQRLWWRRRRVELICSGVSLQEFHPTNRDEARAQLGWLSADRIVLFSYGVWYRPNKRRELVEEACRLANARIPLRLVVLEDVLAADVPRYINAADVVVMASEFEGSPNIVKEALACNVPVCSVAVGDVPEMLADVDASLIVEPTPSAIADGLVRILARAPLRSDGRRFSSRFDADILTRRVLEVLQRAALP